MVEEIQFRSPIHLALQEFDTRYLPFNLPRAPWLTQRSLYAWVILPQSCRKASKFYDTTRLAGD